MQEVKEICSDWWSNSCGKDEAEPESELPVYLRSSPHQEYFLKYFIKKLGALDPENDVCKDSICLVN